jgi:hypothetical protein
MAKILEDDELEAWKESERAALGLSKDDHERLCELAIRLEAVGGAGAYMELKCLVLARAAQKALENVKERPQ